MQYDVVLKYYETAETSDERNSALRTLGQSRDPKLRQRTLDLLLGDKVRDQDIYIPIGSLRSSKAGIEALFEWLQTRWDDIYTKFPAQSSMIGSIVSYCTSGLTKQEQLDQLDRFFDAKDKKGFVRALSQSTDSIKAKIAWTSRDTEDLRKFLGL